MIASSAIRSVSVGDCGFTTRGRLDLTAEWISASEVHVVVGGEIDMHNAAVFGEEVLRRMGDARRMVLDLRGVSFFASAGFTALCHIENDCRSANVDWAVEPGRAVSRTLEICRPLAATSFPVTA